MSLPSTLTLNVGSPAADVVFDDKGTVGNKTEFYAPSPNGDLAGRVKLRVEHETTNAGIERSLVSFEVPQQDGNGDYSSLIKVNTVLTRPQTASLTEVDRVLEMIQEVFAVTNFRDAIGKSLN